MSTLNEEKLIMKLFLIKLSTCSCVAQLSGKDSTITALLSIDLIL